MPTLSQARDALQQRLLTYLYRGSESSSLVLKGGAAMRVLTESAVAGKPPKDSADSNRASATGKRSGGDFDF
jgi:hypothetical protein